MRAMLITSMMMVGSILSIFILSIYILLYLVHMPSRRRLIGKANS
jgi:hypothetical protein